MLTSIDGVDVHVEGEGDHAVVMVHGWPDTYRLWEATADHLMAAFPGQLRCVRFSLPGYDLAKPARKLTVKELVDFLANVIDQVSPSRPVTLMLHDWGCVFGYQYLAQHPERVARLVGVDIGDHNSGALVRALSFKQKMMMVGYQLWLALAWAMGRMGLRGLGNRMTRSMAASMRWRGDTADIGWQMNYPYWVQWATGGMRGMAKVAPQCPTLYTWGKRKPFQFQSRGWLDKLAAQPGCAVQSFETGHWVMVQQPAAFNECVAAWLARTPLTTPATTPANAP